MVEPDWRLGGDSVEITEFPVWTWVLRLAAPSPDMLAALEPLLGATLPAEPCTATGQCPRLLWLAPGQWAILGPREDPELAGRIEAMCVGTLAHIADLMRGWTGFALASGGARDLLAKGCSLDLHPRTFADNRCARTLLGQVPVVIERSGDAFRLYVDCSLADHTRRWLTISASRELPQ